MAAADEFSRSVDMGLRLSKRIYYGKDHHHLPPSTAAPKPASMDKCLSSSSSSSVISSFRVPQNHRPTAPMVYAVIAEPGVVDNPEIRSYQPYVHGRCDPPALIPLNMVGVTLEVECFLDTAFVSVTGTWRLHCVTSTAVCDCRVAIPMGDDQQQGSVLGVEVETSTASYFTQFISPTKDNNQHTTAKSSGFFMKPNIYMFKISQVEGGSNFHVKVRWSQKMLHQGHGFGLSLPFAFPAHVFPALKKVPCREKIVLHVNSGTCTQITCNTCTHPLKRHIYDKAKNYFLEMLANIGKGCYDFAYDVDSISFRMQRLLDKATTPLLSNITLDGLENLESHELFPFRLPDLWFGSPLIVSGRFEGNFPDIVKVRGFLGDLSTYVIDVKVRKEKDMPLDMVCARREVDTLTAQAWLDQDTKLEDKVAKMSLQRGVPSEYTRMILVQNENIKPSLNSVLQEEKYIKSKNQKISCLMNLNVGFGNLIATAENLPPGIEELKLNEPTGKMMQAASCCWTIFRDRFCCKCFIQTCDQLNDQCAIVLAELCTALACFQFLSCCCDTCDSCSEMCSCL